MLSRRTRIQFRDFICKSQDHHEFRAAVKLELADDGAVSERSALFDTAHIRNGETIWAAVPICVRCGSIAEERATYDPASAAIATSERLQVWLSPDGRRVAIPGKRDSQMPERYVVAGYRTIEAHSLVDIDRIERIRAEQTGNTVENEMNYSPAERAWRNDKPYDPDSMTE